LERAHFLAQCAHESGDFQWTQEQGELSTWLVNMKEEPILVHKSGDGLNIMVGLYT
jgi:hypothetical protein